MSVLMRCGHVVVDNKTSKPVCPSCYTTTGKDWYTPSDSQIFSERRSDDAPDLTGRVSQCGHCKKQKPSSLDLPFFAYRGTGSYYAIDHCICGLHCKDGVHPTMYNDGSPIPMRRCGGVYQERGPAEFDGCMGDVAALQQHRPQTAILRRSAVPGLAQARIFQWEDVTKQYKEWN